MNAAVDPITVALTGMLPFVLLGGAVLAFPTSLLLLWLYRRAVIQGMAAGAGEPALTPPTGAEGDEPVAPLRIVTVGALDRAGRIRLEGAPVLRRVAWAYGFAGGIFAAVMTGAVLVSGGDPNLGFGKLLLLWWLHAWPALLAVNLCAASGGAEKGRSVGLYFAGYAVLVTVALARNPNVRAVELSALWLITNGPATVLLASFLARRIRAVGPLVLPFALVALLGSQLALSGLEWSPRGARVALGVASRLGLGGTAAFWGTFAVGLALFAGLGFLLLRWLAARYAAKRFSDESLVLDAVFLLFGVVQSFGLAFEGWPWIGSGLAAFAAYRLAKAAAFRLIGPSEHRGTLLLLRVFALGARSERLFDGLRRHWLRRGNLVLIAGPDLVNTTVEPDEFLDFVSGRLGRRFVHDHADLDRRAGAVDRAPDPDGRFRVTEFFCRADTWQPTMRRLARQSDAVLMDLRSFSPANRGCLYELGALLETVDLDRVVFLVDSTTDHAFLEERLSRLWEEVGGRSVNGGRARPTARLFSAASTGEADLRMLLSLLTSMDRQSSRGSG